MLWLLVDPTLLKPGFQPCGDPRCLLVLVSVRKEAPSPHLSTPPVKPHLPEERLGLLDLPCPVSRPDDVPEGVGIR